VATAIVDLAKQSHGGPARFRVTEGTAVGNGESANPVI
jgi:hypothetical protein